MLATMDSCCRAGRARDFGRRCRDDLGFTLIELVVAIAMASILLGVAVPSFQAAMRSNRVATLANDLVASLQLARSEAVTRGAQVTLCKSSTVAAAAPACSTTASWGDGWLIFVDGGTRGSIDGTDQLLKVGQPPDTAATIAGDANFADYLSYLPTGLSKGASTPDGSISICIAPEQRRVQLNNTGRVSVKKGTCN